MTATDPRPLHRRIDRTIPSDPTRHDALAADLDRLAEGEGGAALRSLLDEDAGLAPFLVGVFSNSPFLRDLGFRDAGRLARILSAPPEVALAELIARTCAFVPDDATLMRVLREGKQEAALLIALADLSGSWELEAVTGGLTAFADAAV